MKFRSPTDQPIYVSSTDGHCAWVGPQWCEVHPLLKAKALAAGCISDAMDTATVDDITTAATTPGHDAKAELMAIIKDMMNNPKDGYFTPKNLPNLRVLTDRMNRRVSREEMMQAMYALGVEVVE